MATVVQTATAHIVPAGATRTLTFPSAVTAGNTIIVAVTAYDSANAVTWSVTDNKNGATAYSVADYVSAVITGSERENCGIVYFENTAGSTGANSFTISIAFTHGDASNASVCSAIEVSGLKTSGSIDRHNHNSQVSSTSSANVANTLANQANSGLSVATMVLYAGSTTEGISLSGYTNVDVIQDGNSANPSSVDYQILTSNETTSVTYTHSHSIQTGWVAALATFQDAGGSPPAPAPLSNLTVMRQFPLKSPLNPNQYRAKPKAFSLTNIAAIVGTAGLAIGQTGALAGSGALSGNASLSVGEAGILGATGALSGSSSLVIGESGQISGMGALTASAALTVSETAQLGAQGALAGSTAISFSQTGSLTQPGLSGSSSLLVGQSGSLTGDASLLGSASITIGEIGALNANGALMGISALAIASTATILATGALDANAGISFSAIGTLSQPGLSGSSALIFGQTGLITANGSLAGNSPLTLNTTGALTQPGITGSSALLFGQSGNVFGIGSIAGTTSWSIGAIGTLEGGAGPIHGGSALSFDGSGDLIGTAALVGTTSIHLSAVFQRLIGTGGPRYVISRIRKRRFSLNAMSYSQFEPKAPDEAVKLTFDFSVDLEDGVTLTGTPVVMVSTFTGSDANPSDIENGLPLLDVTNTQVIVPVIGGLDGVQYKVHVQTSTTDSEIVLSLSGILPVIA